MASVPQEAFYAGLLWVMMRETNVDEVLEKARAQKVQFLIVDEDMEKELPGFMERTRKGDLVLLKEWKGSGKSVTLFQMVRP